MHTYKHDGQKKMMVIYSGGRGGALPRKKTVYDKH